jgi:8-oxo-dGTP pyrophosphatase MutT (NUDIX family)
MTFKNQIKSKLRKGIFILVYYLENKIPKYLILKRKLHWKGFEFPKGGIEKNERYIDAVKRELKEETGLIPLKIKSHNFKGKYLYKKKFLDRTGFAGQTFVLFSVQTKNSKVFLDKREHSNYHWLSYEQAQKKLAHQNQKKSLSIVDDWLMKNDN